MSDLAPYRQTVNPDLSRANSAVEQYFVRGQRLFGQKAVYLQSLTLDALAVANCLLRVITGTLPFPTYQPSASVGGDGFKAALYSALRYTLQLCVQFLYVSGQVPAQVSMRKKLNRKDRRFKSSVYVKRLDDKRYAIVRERLAFRDPGHRGQRRG